MPKPINEYNDDLAFHYKSYRPPLHEFLLNRIFKNQKFKTALDVGCGTGNSSIALTRYCESITGYDHSKSMIHQSQKHPKVYYTNEINQLNNNYDLIVFFGSLFYINENEFILYQNQLSKDGFLLCSDFQILYEPILSKLRICLDEIKYDYSKNLESYNTNLFELINYEKFHVEFSCQLNEVIHLLLSENQIKRKLKIKYEPSDIFQNLTEELEIQYPQNVIKLKANLFYSYYKKIIV